MFLCLFEHFNNKSYTKPQNMTAGCQFVMFCGFVMGKVVTRVPFLLCNLKFYATFLSHFLNHNGLSGLYLARNNHI